MTGLECHMGRDVQPNMGHRTRLLSPPSLLCGNEGFMMEVQGLLEHANQGTLKEHEELRHVVIPLLGEFKGEQ
eukprot:13140944-Ditylum_brightwellii.AAC.1